uniref:PEHE domain-containing protein n=1 Tax=Plectus sambesii TaxID=2011161 RepID=A0A914WIV9_9BILA
MAPALIAAKMDVNEHDYNLPKADGVVDGVRYVRIDESPDRLNDDQPVNGVSVSPAGQYARPVVSGVRTATPSDALCRPGEPAAKRIRQIVSHQPQQRVLMLNSSIQHHQQQQQQHQHQEPTRTVMYPEQDAHGYLGRTQMPPRKNLPFTTAPGDGTDPSTSSAVGAFGKPVVGGGGGGAAVLNQRGFRGGRQTQRGRGGRGQSNVNYNYVTSTYIPATGVYTQRGGMIKQHAGLTTVPANGRSTLNAVRPQMATTTTANAVNSVYRQNSLPPTLTPTSGIRPGQLGAMVSSSRTVPSAIKTPPQTPTIRSPAPIVHSSVIGRQVAAVPSSPRLVIAKSTAETKANASSPRATVVAPPPPQQPPVVTAPPTIGDRQTRLMRLTAELVDRSARLEYAQALYHGVDEVQTLVGRCIAASDGDAPPQKASARSKQAALEAKLEVMLKSKQFRFREEELRKKTPAELARLIRKYEARAGLCESVSPAAARYVLGQARPLTFDIDTSSRVERTVDALTGHVCDLLRVHDPAATDSSSDSDDDNDVGAHDGPRRKRLIRLGSGPSTSVLPQHYHPVSRSTATWKWHRERSSLASRYNWLMSQISDLDYKIRQQVDVCSQLQARKRPLDFEQPPSPSASDADQTCARVRALRSRPERKLVRTAGTFRWNNKTKRLATVHCGCSPPFGACVLCTGRTNNVDVPPDPCSQTTRERYAIVDPALHPVLSDAAAMTYERRLEAHLKRLSSNPKSSVPKRPPPSPSKIAKQNSAVQPASLTTDSAVRKKDEERKGNNVQGERKVSPLKLTIPRGAIKLNVGQKLVKKSAEAQRKKLSMKPKLKLSGKLKKQLGKSRQVAAQRSRLLSYGSKPFSSQHSPSKPPGKLASSRRNTINHPNTYDFDNIVIDPSVLAASKIEKLQYKEIATPGWRKIQLEPTDITLEPVVDLSEVEDIDNEVFIERHNVKESEERNRFQVYKDSVFTMGRRLTDVVASEVKQGRSRSGSIDAPRQLSDYGPTSVVPPFPARKFPMPTDF